MLSVDGEPITISLLPRELQQRVPIPKFQFASMKAALNQRDATVKQKTPNDSHGSETPVVSYEMSLQSSFISNGTVFNVEAFTKDALLLRAIPHDTLQLIRAAR